MQYLVSLGQWAYANPGFAAAIVVAIYAFATKKLTVQGLIQEIIADIQRYVKGPGPAPTPAPAPTDELLALLQQLITLLNDAKQSGDREQEASALVLLDHTINSRRKALAQGGSLGVETKQQP